MRHQAHLLGIGPPASRRGTWLRIAAAGALTIAAAAALPRAHASAAMCSGAANCRPIALDLDEPRYTGALQRSTFTGGVVQRIAPSDKDLSTFSGVGVVACTTGGVTRSSTAFLVGSFDIAVTVANTFEHTAGDPAECHYNSVDSYGQVRERIPVAYVKSQRRAAGDKSEPAKNLAVLRLTKPSRYAQRTMPLGRYSGAPTPAVLIGYKADMDVDTVKRKARGTVYSGRANAVPGAFSHDINSADLAAGSPLIDERSGVIIGVHIPVDARRNTMVTMNEWLETTLREEMKLAEQTGAKAVER